MKAPMKAPNLRKQRLAPKIAIISPTDLKEGCTYFSAKDEIVRVDSIDNEKKEINTFNISEQIHYYYIKFANINLVKRIR